MPAQTPKYELLRDRVATASGSPAFRIRALRDIPEHRVRAGDLGGYVEGEHNLSHENAAWIADQAKATGRSRVEDHALAKDNATLSDNAVLSGSAVLGGHSLVRGHAVIRDRARIMGASTIGDHVLVSGDVNVRHSVTLWGDGQYRRQGDVPWSLRDAEPTEPGYLDRLQGAVEIDPAFHRVLAALGAPDAPSRRAAVTELFHGPAEGQKALASIVRLVGGTFHPDAYKPRSTADVVSTKAAEIAVQTSTAKLREFRYLRSLNLGEGGRLASGTRIYGGVVYAETHDPETGTPLTLFQPALLVDAAPEEPTLSPLGGRVLISREVYTSLTDATARADKIMKEATTPEGHEPVVEARSSMIGERLRRSLDHLPFVFDAQPVHDGSLGSLARITLQSGEVYTPGIGQHYEDLRKPTDFATIEVSKHRDAGLSLSRVAASSGLVFHHSTERACQNVVPIYSDRSDLVQRLTREIEAREARIAVLRGQGALPGALGAELRSLDPVDEPVLVRVIEVPRPTAPDATNPVAGIAYETLKASLRPLDWSPVPDPKNPTRHIDGALEAKSLHARFSIEEDMSGWSLFVENPEATQYQRVYHLEPFHEQHGLDDEAAAREAAEVYRANLIAAELGVPTPAQRLEQAPAPASSSSQPVELPAAFRVRHAGGVSYKAGTIGLKEGRVVVTTQGGAHSTLEAAIEAAAAPASRPQPTSTPSPRPKMAAPSPSL